VVELSDELIMQRVKEGNLADMTILFERYHLRLYNFFLKLTFNKSISEDLTQNLFYRILKYKQTFNKDNGTFKSWIYQLARNVHTDFYKLEKKINNKIKSEEHLNENIPVDEQIFDEDDYNKLEHALKKLHPDQLEIIVLSRFQGLKYEEISKIKNISVSAIKVQMHRTMKHLREIFFNNNN
jgi:RNA polymerase sigma-70 factor (ECF subfamily)